MNPEPIIDAFICLYISVPSTNMRISMNVETPIVQARNLSGRPGPRRGACPIRSFNVNQMALLPLLEDFEACQRPDSLIRPPLSQN